MKCYIRFFIALHISMITHASWKEHMTFPNILTVLNITAVVSIKIYDELQKDPHQQERVKLLAQQHILLNKQDLQKGDQAVEENKLFLQKSTLEIEKGQYQNQLLKIQTQTIGCEKYIEALKKITEILPVVSEEKRIHLHKDLEQDIEQLVRTNCGFKENLTLSPNIAPKIV